jgi:hypothetical protein
MTKLFTLNAHERINTNDCYLKFKHQYEYVSNLDFDEIIFPRKQNVTTSFDFNISTRVNYSLNRNITQTYNIYNYVKKFFINTNISSIEFQHVLFIQDYKKLLNSSNNDYLFTNETRRVEEYSKLIQERILTIELELSYWKIPYGFYLTSRRGKSIHNTDLVEGINQHYATSFKYSNSSATLIVPLSSGFVSHFREIELPELHTQDFYTLKNFLIDLEYYYFF